MNCTRPINSMLLKDQFYLSVPVKFYAVEKPNLLKKYPLDSMLLKNHFKISKTFSNKMR